MNKINQAVEVQNGNQIDARKRKPWPSVKAALLGITGIQRQIGILIPVKSDLRAIQYHFDGGTDDKHFIPYDTRINQSDALLFAGATLADDLASITLSGTQWRISDVLHTLQNPITYPVDPVSAGQFRADIIYADYQGNTNYLKGTEGGTAIAPEAPYKTVLVTTIFVSDSAVTEEPPTLEYPDVQLRRGEGNPTQALGIAGDSYLNTLNGEVWFKDTLVGDTATWALRYTPTGGEPTRFGIEDNTGVQDRYIALGVHNLYIDSFTGSYISFDGTNGFNAEATAGGERSTINILSDAAQLYSDGPIGETYVQAEAYKGFISSNDGTNTRELTVSGNSTSIRRDGGAPKEIVTSVNGEVADASGNITLTGLDGADGQGVPVGGTALQVLRKVDGTDYNTEWADAAGGGAGSLQETTDIGNITTKDIVLNGSVVQFKGTPNSTTVIDWLDDGFPQTTPLTALNVVRNPIDFHIDTNGDVYIGDEAGNRVVKFNLNSYTALENGVVVAGTGTTGNTLTTLNGATQVQLVGVDLYVMDKVNTRVLKFTAGSATGTVYVSGVSSFPQSTFRVKDNGDIYLISEASIRFLAATNPTRTYASATTIYNLDNYGTVPRIFFDSAGVVYFNNHIGFYKINSHTLNNVTQIFDAGSDIRGAAFGDDDNTLFYFTSTYILYKRNLSAGTQEAIFGSGTSGTLATQIPLNCAAIKWHSNNIYFLDNLGIKRIVFEPVIERLDTGLCISGKRILTEDNTVAFSADTAAPIGGIYSQSEVQAILTELRDLKSKMRGAGLLL